MDGISHCTDLISRNSTIPIQRPRKSLWKRHPKAICFSLLVYFSTMEALDVQNGSEMNGVPSSSLVDANPALSSSSAPPTKRKYVRRKQLLTKEERKSAQQAASGPPADISLAEYQKVVKSLDGAWVPPSLATVVYDSVAVPVPSTLGAVDADQELTAIAEPAVREVFLHNMADASTGPNGNTRHNLSTVKEPVTAPDGSCFFVPVSLMQLPSLHSILNPKTWTERLSVEERNFLRSFLPPGPDGEKYALQVLSSENVMFGNPVDRVFEGLVAGEFHPLVVREKVAADTMARADYAYRTRMYHNLMVKSAKSVLAGVLPSRQFPASVAGANAETESEVSDSEK